MKVVANSSVLIGWSAIERLNLLKQRFPEGLLVPEAVWREVVQEGAGRLGAGEVASAQWITVQAVQHRAVLALLEEDLDTGEAEAIALAQEVDADLVLLDEKTRVVLPDDLA